MVFARNLKCWYRGGYPQLSDKSGSGIGNWVRWVIQEETFEQHPYETAMEVWELGDCSSAENRSSMRTAYIGCLNYPIEHKLKLTDLICRVTHPDPRCVAACIYVVVCVSEFVG